MSKIALMTYWAYNDNYGQLFQLYALYSYLVSLGHDVRVIRYEHLRDKTIDRSIYDRFLEQIENPLEMLKKIYRRWKYRKQYATISICPCNDSFENFKVEKIKWTKIYNTFEELQSDPPKSDIYICGSDMIWAERRERVDPFFLNFGSRDIKRIAYSPSFGKNNISLNYGRKISSLLQRFNAVSVREKSGIDICNKLGYINVCWLPDPTLLLNEGDYKSLEVSPILKSGYIFMYILHPDSKVDLCEIESFAKGKKMRIMYRAGQGRLDNLEKIYPSPQEWLGLIHYANYVITNSFHGCVFSVIYRKKFLYLPLTGEKETANERVFSFLDKVNLKSRVMKSSLLEIDKKIDYNLVHDLLAVWIKEGKEYLKKSIGGSNA